ncbi:MAG: hypothetical protein JRM86_03280 [Nitrososphaerota archaeon]|nr:hypothetical protein [Nitrososphaerota archaeon]MDG6966581.1 hypothetical protein [Nitrososphaerota archaeon]MDG6978560.1 hypothetical protein [Nitrososphaerota archaeon]MDG7005938.1 hypothetical protein [Nitrososphaerota archaeon]MDG7020758.1 hypothetical protein [Nitrososphaerota archaeon]
MTDPQLAATFFPHALSGAGATVYALVLALVALALMFAGRSVVKGLAFLVAGLAGAAFGAGLAGPVLGPVGLVIGGIAGFLVGGMLGVWLVELGIGLAIGYFAYLAARYLTHSLLLAAVVGVALFFVGLAVSGELLELATAALGGVIIYGVLLFFGSPPLDATVLSVVLAAAGLYVQWTGRRRREPWRQG